MIGLVFNFDEEKLGNIEEKLFDKKDNNYRCVADAFSGYMVELFQKEGFEVRNPMYNSEMCKFDIQLDKKIGAFIEKIGFGVLYDNEDNYIRDCGNDMCIEYMNENFVDKIEYVGEKVDNVIDGVTIYFDKEEYTKEDIINNL